MIWLQRKLGIWRDHVLFFPTVEEVNRVRESRNWYDIIRVRQTPVILPDSYAGIVHREKMATWCIDLTQDLDVIYRNMEPKSCRYMIRKAERYSSNVSVQMNGEEVCRDFLHLYNDFVRQKGHTSPLTNRRFAEYRQAGDVRVLYYNGRPICGNLVLRDPTLKRVVNIYSASVRLNNADDAAIAGMFNRYLRWQELQFYKSQGMEIFDFCGISVGGAAVGPKAKYKMSFGGFIEDGFGYVIAGPVSSRALKAAYESYVWLRKKQYAVRMAFKGSGN